ncbi:MAG: hypothetical protein OJF49_004076 [Ktedonobacterales bacterium]|nr:MAG: hypothetical protein OJF49_004076 [Ktedonobacterales bacterium]
MNTTARQTSLPDEPAINETEPTEPTKIQRGRAAHRSRAKSIPKVSYESSASVQNWLRAQEIERVGIKPDFAPEALSHQRDRLWVLSSLSQFYEDDLITDVLHTVKSGKEATVYCCAAHPATNMPYAAAKVYRPRMFRGLKNDAIYRESRAQFDASGHEVRSRREIRGAMKKTERGRATEISSWIHYEFDTQQRLYEAGADVPKPLAQLGNAVLMEYIGAQGDAAPLLQGVALPPGEAGPLFARVLRNIELFLACNRIHGDLSGYNILYWQGAITIIDFAQAVDPRYNGGIFPLLARDVARVCAYFARYGIEANAVELASEMWTRYLGGPQS